MNLLVSQNSHSLCLDNRVCKVLLTKCPDFGNLMHRQFLLLPVLLLLLFFLQL